MSARAVTLDPDVVGEELQTQATALTRRLGDAVVITSNQTLAQVVIDRSLIADAMRAIVNFLKPFKSQAHQLHADLCARERDLLKPLQAADALRVEAIRTYHEAQDRARLARERALAEQQRVDEQARATAEAAALEAAGQPEIAAAVIAEAIAAPAPVVSLPDATANVEGLRFRRRWLWRFAGGPKDVKTTPAAVRARALAIVPREFLTLDEVKLGQYVRAMKDAGKVPGIEIYSVEDPVR